MTNIERIRGMTEDEMAEFLCSISKSCFFEECEECALEYPYCKSWTLLVYWLKSEVEE